MICYKCGKEVLNINEMFLGYDGKIYCFDCSINVIIKNKIETVKDIVLKLSGR